MGVSVFDVRIVVSVVWLVGRLLGLLLRWSASSLLSVCLSGWAISLVDWMCWTDRIGWID